MTTKTTLTRPVYRVDVQAGTTPVRITKKQAIGIRQLTNGHHGAGLFYITDDSLDNFGNTAVMFIAKSRYDVDAITSFNCWEHPKNAKQVVQGMRVYVLPEESTIKDLGDTATGGYFFTASGRMYSTNQVAECWPSWIEAQEMKVIGARLAERFKARMAARMAAN